MVLALLTPGINFIGLQSARTVVKDDLAVSVGILQNGVEI